MTCTEWFFLFLAVFGWIVGWCGLSSQAKEKEKSDFLRNCLNRERCINQELKSELKKQQSKSRAFFDFEKVNNRKEK